METVKFCVVSVGNDMCRVVPVDIRSMFQKIANGGCIMGVDVLLDEMDYINAECEKIGFKAVFIR